MIIYIAGAIRDRYNPKPNPIIDNVNAGIDMGIRVYLKGHIPIIPMLHYYMRLRDMEKFGEKLKWSDYMLMDLHSIIYCNAILKISSSHGADLEEIYIKQHLKCCNKKIYYNINDIPDNGSFNYSEKDIEEIFHGRMSIRK